MTRAEILKVANMIFDIGESSEHYVDMEYCTKRSEVSLYVFKKYDDTSRIADSITINSLDEEAMAWIERWTAALRKERVLV